MIRILAPPKPPLYFIPGEMNYRRAAMHIVGWKSRVAQRREERSHLPLRQFFSSLDRCLAGNCRGEALVFGRDAGDAVPSQGIQRLTQAALGVEARMWHRNGVDDERMSAESFDLESQALEVFPI